MNEAVARISVVIPALNEAESIAAVVRGCLATNLSREVIVVDNGSTDRTADNARAAGAKIISETKAGYGRACTAGIRALSPECEIVVFLDGDGSDCPEMMAELVRPILNREKDFVIGSRTRGRREPGSMNLQQRFAGRLAGWLVSILYGVRYTDMCPFRAIRREALDRLRRGIPLDGHRTLPATVVLVNEYRRDGNGVLRLTIREGRNRQVRRMCEAVGHPVQTLSRVRIGSLADRSLRVGQWRELTLREVERLKSGTSERGKVVKAKSRPS